MTSAAAISAGSSFVETSEHRRFADFCDACRRYRYIGLCYGVPGVGKTLLARTYAEWALVEPLVLPGAAYVDTVPSVVGECRTLFYTPPVVNSPARIASELERLRNLLNWVLGVAQAETGHAPTAAPNDQTELVVIDEADRLKSGRTQGEAEHAPPYAPSLIACSMTFAATARPSASPPSQALRK